MTRGEATGKLQQLADLVNTRKEEALHDLGQAVDSFQKDVADERYRHLWHFRDLEQEIGNVPKAIAVATPTYVIGSLFLDHCKSVLTMDEKEYMVTYNGEGIAQMPFGNFAKGVTGRVNGTVAEPLKNNKDWTVEEV